MNGPLRVGIVYDGAAVEEPYAFESGPNEAQAVESIIDVVVEIERALLARGHSPFRVALPADASEILRVIAGLECDVLFNFVESLRGTAALEGPIRGVMAVRGIAVTGASVDGLVNCLHKPRTRALLVAAGVPVAPACLISHGGEDASALPHPVIVKPAAQDASHGIDRASVCKTPDESKARAMLLIERGIGPALVEQFVDGREYNVSMIETFENGERRLRALPIAEIDFSGFPEGTPRILTYAAKWDTESPEYKGSVSVRASIPEPLRASLERHALAAFRALDLSGYGRADFRVDADGNPYVVDVNPNPDFSRGAGFHLAGERAGMTYEDLVEHVARSASL